MMFRTVKIGFNSLKKIDIFKQYLFVARSVITKHSLSSLHFRNENLNISPVYNTKHTTTLRLRGQTTKQTRRHYSHECVKKLQCWKCSRPIDAELEQFICACGVVQPPISTRSYFQIFDIDEEFKVDVKKLKQRHQRLQNLLHPDKCAGKSDSEKSFAEQHSSMVNEAYYTLQHPLTRGLYLLHMNPRDDKLETEIDVDSDFLASMMELNEAVMECGDEKELLQIEKKNMKEMDVLVVEIEKDFASKDHRQAKQHLLRMKYLHSAAERIKEIKRELY